MMLLHAAAAAVACLISSTAVATAFDIPTLNIAPGVDIPMVGLGTWQYSDTVAEYSTSLALDLGYTHIDTALGYDNQVGIATAALELSLSQLGLDYVDLMLVHYPATWGGVGGKAVRADQWRAMEDFHKAGK